MGLWNLLPYLQEVGEARSSAGVGVGQVTLSATEGRLGYGGPQEVPGGSFPGSFCDDLCKATVQRLGERCERRTRAGRSEDPPRSWWWPAWGTTEWDTEGHRRVGGQQWNLSTGLHDEVDVGWKEEGSRRVPGSCQSPGDCCIASGIGRTHTVGQSICTCDLLVLVLVSCVWVINVWAGAPQDRCIWMNPDSHLGVN